MSKITTDTKTEFQKAMERRLARREKSEAMKQYSRQFFSQVPLAELRTKDWDYAEAVMYSSWRFFKSFNGRRPKVRVFNPSSETDGYVHKNTIIEVAAKNLPFLLDSIRIELGHHDIGLVDVEQCLLHVVRDGKGGIHINSDEEPNETLIHLEVHRPRSTRSLEKDIREVLRLVQCAVDDFAPMRRQLLLWSDEFGIAAASGKNPLIEEASQTLQWLYANNFTFLGYEEFHEHRNKNRRDFRLVAGSELGLARDGYYAAGRAFTPADTPLAFSKSPSKSRVHRPTYFDEIIISRKENGLVRSGRFIGLFTSSVFNQSPGEIPVVSNKIAHIYDHLGLTPVSHKGRAIGRILEVLPREELFLSDLDTLTHMVETIYALQERRIVRVMVRRDEHFVNCMIYLPRDTYDTRIRLKIQDLLVRKFDAIHADFSTLFSESALIRIHFVLRVPSESAGNVDVDELEAIITGYTRSWEDGLRSVLITEDGEIEGQRKFNLVKGVFPPGYRHDYWPATAYGDIDFILSLTDETRLKVCMYQWRIGSDIEIRFKLFHLGGVLPLSDVIPILENLGARTLEEHPYELSIDGQTIWLHDFVLDLTAVETADANELKQKFEEAFLEIWAGDKENDTFNRLVTAANIDVRRVWLLRAYARYLGQLNIGVGQSYIADCILRHSEIATLFLKLFDARFDPHLGRRKASSEEKALKSQILEAIERVENLLDDRILRAYLEMICATLRTNYFQLTGDGASKDYVSLKFSPAQISEMPQPKPRYEIFVYSCRVEGVHLRGGKIARGGLRWSDRSEDYRTEVLGLVKAQQVKNSVIVPQGAKGGFLPKKSMAGASREEIMEEGIYCYRVFINGLLDVTDNLVKGKVVPPVDVIRHDEDDYYLVVAADKGTATFSDYANELATSRGFWLGDAFASGGSNGYDHKQMGITAKGAWESVHRHFSDRGHDIQNQDFTVVGIGDMSGDVFGNGMLLSEHICLVAAFNHLHIFVDPNPDAASSYKERKRLFELPRSSWGDYDQKLISRGGGVFSRDAKAVAITAEMKQRFGIRENSLTPNRLITYILKAKVDLLWNGGIGTYIKSRQESNLEVGDKANDAIRVNGEQLRAAIVGEGGNLGLTQLGRIEYSLAGGTCFTDFIDNAGGVNCSDAEVNIKIFLNHLMEKGDLTENRRRKMLQDMTDAVSDMVLDNNYRQALAINLMQHQAVRRNLEYARVIDALEERGYLNRSLEFLPTAEEVLERQNRNQSLTAPELSVLTSYVKNAMKERLGEEGFDDPYVMKELYTAFPASLVRRYEKELRDHRLRREIIGTQVANNLVNNMGISFIARITETTGATRAQIAYAYIGARDIYGMEQTLDEIQALDGKVAPDVQKNMLMDLIRLVRRSTRWLLRNRRDALNLTTEVPQYRKAVTGLEKDWQRVLDGASLEQWERSATDLQTAGVPERLAKYIAASHHLYTVLGMVEVSRLTGENLSRVAAVLFGIGEQLRLHWFSRQMHEYQATTQWEALARESLQDDLNWQQIAIALAVINEGTKRQSPRQMIERWIAEHDALVARWLDMQSEIEASVSRDLSIFTVAIRELMDLSQSSLGTSARLGQG